MDINWDIIIFNYTLFEQMLTKHPLLMILVGNIITIIFFGSGFSYFAIRRFKKYRHRVGLKLIQPMNDLLHAYSALFSSMKVVAENPDVQPGGRKEALKNSFDEEMIGALKDFPNVISNASEKIDWVISRISHTGIFMSPALLDNILDLEQSLRSAQLQSYKIFSDLFTFDTPDEFTMASEFTGLDLNEIKVKFEKIAKKISSSNSDYQNHFIKRIEAFDRLAGKYPKPDQIAWLKKLTST